MQAEEKGFVDPSNCDGLLEVVAFKSGYHAGVVMAGGMHAVRLAQAAGVRMHVRGSEEEGIAYMQLDGEPWKQSVPGSKTPESEALQVRATLKGYTFKASSTSEVTALLLLDSSTTLLYLLVAVSTWNISPHHLSH